MKLIYTLLLGCCSYTAFSQQLPLFTQYRDYSGMLNPASVPNDYLWYEKTMSFGASYRKQWIAAEDGPSTQSLRADYIALRRGVIPVFGAYLLNDKAGRMGMTGFYLRSAMLFSDDPLEYGFSVGLSAGLVRYALDLSNPHVQDPGALAIYDKRNSLNPDAGLGVFGYTTLRNNHLLYGGLSVPQVIGLNTRFQKADQTFSIKRVPHFYGTVGYKIPLRDEYSFLEGSVWIRYVTPLAPSLDFNMRWQFESYMYVGTGFGTNGNAHLEAGFIFGEDRLFRMGMSGDFPFTQISSYYGSALEVNFGYALDRQR